MTHASPASPPRRAVSLRREEWLAWLLPLPALLLVALTVLVPVGVLGVLSLVVDGQASLANYAKALSRSYAAVYVTTLSLAAVVTAACALLGLPVAYLLTQLPSRIAAAGLALVALPIWVGTLVKTFSWLILLQRNGPVNGLLVAAGLTDKPLALLYNFAAVAAGATNVMLPFMVLPLYNAMKSIDANTVRAAASLGASPSRVFRDVVMPQALPGLGAGSLLIFIVMLGFYMVPQLLGGGKVQTLAIRIQQSVVTSQDYGMASALGIVLLVIVFAALALPRALARLRRGRTS